MLSLRGAVNGDGDPRDDVSAAVPRDTDRSSILDDISQLLHAAVNSIEMITQLYKCFTSLLTYVRTWKYSPPAFDACVQTRLLDACAATAQWPLLAIYRVHQ